MRPTAIENWLRKLLPAATKYRLRSFPAKIGLMGYGLLYPFCRKQYASDAWQYSLTAKQIYGEAARLPGVSGYYRIYNEEEFLAASVESHLPFFDELVLVHDSTTTDKTPEIARALANKYPDKVKYFFYEPAVYKLGTSAYKMLPIDHPNSFINYYNFALSKTTRQIVAKVDADHIAIDTQFAKIMHDIRDTDFMDTTFQTFTGIDLWFYHNELYVDPRPLIVGDHGFYKMRPEKFYYTKKRRYEDGYFSRKGRKIVNAGVLYFHLKNMRSNIPYDSYRGLDDAVHREKFKQRRIKAQQRWLDWETFVEKYRDVFLTEMATDLAELPDPNVYLQTLIANSRSIMLDEHDKN